jgi:hypothetical protein
MSDNEVDALIEKIPDVVGTFYKYTLAASLLKRKVMK